MRRAIAGVVAGLLLGAAPPPEGDSHRDLEAVDGAAALATVKAWNARSLATLEAQPHFAEDRARAARLLADPAKIATPDAILGDQVLNLWQDAAHPRGLWRIADLAGFAAGRPHWRTLIDIGALGAAEHRKWVFKGAECLAPAYVRCMVALSDGGGDAVVEREFDLAAGRFVPGGFTLPEAKTSLAWAGPDALYVATEYGPGSMTRSGYARIAKLWRRGTPLAAATLVAEGEVGDVSEAVASYADGDRQWPMVVRGIDFYHRAASHIAPDGRLVASPLPRDAQIEDVLDGRVIASLKSAWQGHPAGAIVAYRIADLLAGRTPAVERVFTPTPRQATVSVAAGMGRLWIQYLDDVSGRLVGLARDPAGHWAGAPVALPDKATVHLLAAAGRSAIAFAEVEAMLQPPTLYAVRPDAAPAVVQALPARFDAAGMTVEQRFATSRDGTRVPYFLVRKPGAAPGPVPALIHAYGGFELPQTPAYLINEPYRSGPAGLFWVERGNAYVLADLRGGGEYGPAWHDAALREKRQNAYDDLYAVAEDLVRTGITARGRIAVSGRSNGGLMAGVAMTQRPDLFGAAVIGSPLLDMKRYSHLLAGASWIGEYGDPDVPADWAFIRRYAPYQNLVKGRRYPVPFLYTSTRDDRVHPGHARKFAARLQDYGDPFFYYEAIEGGHAAGVEPAQDALRAALVAAYLELELPHDGPARHIGPR
ncbi:prolyl oligopeptidase family serine peptidase [Sphingomonas morindae]|uniref:Prolyl oligopeptidase family serine peptidase n=1 Tax=Sphingomonas morindae TaxID=1541170 RepID=A0ABY4XB07_9SPHN|nr:prolyl oligopeptidase family serine peptidase [Sphingomonas morindae]USI74070.1 prolyl oligopeptidase family serine peptidase [Sphingomonas morindae]